ncbi:phage major capsid protein [Sinomonas sp. P47F7]|uniref:phage major capsid protein n=1 Tax=Sinomonas sp. P47F7 TaxID=3410987 RepID=UPI003BF5AB38
MNMAQLIAQLEGSLVSKLEERNKKSTELAELRSAATVDEVRVAQIRQEKQGLDDEIDALQIRVAELKLEKSRDDAAARLSAELIPQGQRRSYDQVIRTGDTNEPRTYTRESAKQGVSFFGDAYAHREHGTNDRIMRHAAEVEHHGEMSQRAVQTSGFAGLVVPQYLIDLAAPKIQAGRGIANAVTRLELPEQGMQLVIPKGNIAASEDVQATENSTVSNTDESWANVTVPVVTIAGKQDVSRQLLERGSGVDAIIYLDLARAYGARLGKQVINGSGLAGQMLGILNTAGIAAAAAFGAAVDASKFGTKVAGANTAVASVGDGIAPDVLLMHPRRWGWLTTLNDTTGRPIVTANTVTNFNMVAVGSQAGEEFANAPVKVAGIHNSGLPIITDVNVPTTVGMNNEDVVLSLDVDELILWEEGDGLPRQLRFEQTKGDSLTTVLVAYGYAAFTAGRYPEAVAKFGGLDTVAGAGLIAPTF